MPFIITTCPNCECQWGQEEMDWGECGACGYPNTDEEKIDDRHCVNCGKQIKIAESLSEIRQKNAIPCSRYIDDDEVYIGGICWECADRLCDEGKLSIGGGGDMAPDACFH